MKKQYLFRAWETAALIALSMLMCSAAWAQGNHQQLNEHVLRLHVLAVSDEESEQQLKLRVRDNVLGYVETLLEEADNIQKAESIIEKNLNGIAKAAFEVSEGRQVTVSLGEESYPSRTYEGGSLPAGKYKALKVILGEGQGHNWWGVVFPSLTCKEYEGVEIVSDEKVFKFKILEIWGELIN